MDSQNMDPNDQLIETLFVQCAEGVTNDGIRMTLKRPANSTLFFSDRPERIVGHVSSKKFVDQWGEGENSFADDPPNAVISFIEDGDKTPEEVTVVLRDPQLTKNSLSYEIKILDGNLPKEGGACSLFIDTIGRPLTPVSVAGVRRREHRRGGR